MRFVGFFFPLESRAHCAARRAACSEAIGVLQFAKPVCMRTYIFILILVFQIVQLFLKLVAASAP